jgi:hypothetical protein
VPVALACNPSCSGGRDQADRGLKPGGTNNSWDPHLENTQYKTGLEQWLK